MTTITDDLAAALRMIEFGNYDDCGGYRCPCCYGPLKGGHTSSCEVRKTLAKYEAAKAQKPDETISEAAHTVIKLLVEVAPNGYAKRQGQQFLKVLVEGGHLPKAQETEKGFPVVKIPGHVVNHMEWKDRALIVTVGKRL